MCEKLGGDTATAVDPNWPKGCSVPYDVMLNNRTGEKLTGGGGLLCRDWLGIGGEQLHWASHYFNVFFYNSYHFPFVFCPVKLSSSQSTSFTFFQVSSPSQR